MTDTPALSALLDQYEYAIREHANWIEQGNPPDGEPPLCEQINVARQRVEEAVSELENELKALRELNDGRERAGRV